MATVEQYYRHQGLWRDDRREIIYTSTVELDMSTVQPALAGPRRPQDRIDLVDMKKTWNEQAVTIYERTGWHGRGAGERSEREISRSPTATS